jgi:hypothetical protein
LLLTEQASPLIEMHFGVGVGVGIPSLFVTTPAPTATPTHPHRPTSTPTPTLKIESQFASSFDELLLWLRHELPSTCLINRDMKHPSYIQI